MNANKHIVVASLLTLVCFWPATTSGQNRWLSPVIVQLRPIAIATESIVSINTIATLSGGSYELRRQIGQLDVAEQPAVQSSERVTNSRVAIRIRLAGISADMYEVRGDETMVMTETVSVPTRQNVLNEIHAGLSARLSVPPAQLEVSLVQAVAPVWEEYAGRPDIRFEPVLPATPRIGQQRIGLSVFEGKQPLKTVPVTVDIRLKKPVPIANRNIARGELLSGGNVRFEIQPVSHQQLSRLPNAVFGQTASRPIRSGKSIESVDVQLRPSQDQQVLIKRRDLVRMVARKGALRVIISNGEALESGKLNEFISVRNPASRKTVRGRVTGPSEIEVPF